MNIAAGVGPSAVVLAFQGLRDASQATPCESLAGIYGIVRVKSAASSVSTAAEVAPRDLDRFVTEMLAGRQQALADLYDATVGKVYSLALRIVRNPADAEEVVCDTYSQAWSRAASFDPARAHALAWLLMICRSRALDRVRQRVADGRQLDVEFLADVPDEGPEPPDLCAMLQEGTRVRDAVAALSPDRQKLVGMAFLKGMSHQEISTATGLPLGTVKSHLRRALAELREALH